MATVVSQLPDGFADVLDSLVAAGFAKAVKDFRLPAQGEFLDRADVKIAVVKPGFQIGHVAGKEAPVLADGAATHGRGTTAGVTLVKRQRAPFRFSFVDMAGPNPLNQAGSLMMGLVPFIHCLQLRVRLANGKHRAFFDDMQLRVGDQGGDFEDSVTAGVQPGHLQIDPDQVEIAVHRIPPASKKNIVADPGGAEYAIIPLMDLPNSFRAGG